MPCRYDESPEEIAAAKTKEFEQLSRSLKKELDTTTRLLCWVMSRYHNSPSAGAFEEDVGTNTELLEWYDIHKQKDEAHKKAKLREKALKKLTREERAALDLL